jgi:hypothetical protein
MPVTRISPTGEIVNGSAPYTIVITNPHTDVALDNMSVHESVGAQSWTMDR